MTINNKSYNNVIELEYIDALTSLNTEIAVAILLFFVEYLNEDEKFTHNKFEVIKYGWQGFYPAIGVRFVDVDIDIDIDIENSIESEFEDFIKKNDFKSFLDFSIKNNLKIREIINDMNK